MDDGGLGSAVAGTREAARRFDMAVNLSRSGWDDQRARRLRGDALDPIAAALVQYLSEADALMAATRRALQTISR